MYKNIFYFDNINAIGGVESFLYYLAKRYNGYDITVFYASGDIKQLSRLKKICRCIKYQKGTIINCDKAFFNYCPSIIDYVNANEYIQVIHADYKLQPNLYKEYEKITKYIGVSKLACENFTELTGKPCELCYHPVEYDFNRQRLILVSAQRMTQEKGLKRIQTLARKLDESNIPYIWFIFTNTNGITISPNVVFMKNRLDIANYISGSDYFIALSDCEAYCFSAVESLCLGVPCVLTPCPVFKEIGFNDENTIFLDFDCRNIDEVVNKMANNKYNFKYEPPKDNWNNILSGTNKDSKYREEIEQIMRVRALVEFFDSEAKVMRNPKGNREFEVTRERFEEINMRGQEQIGKDLIEAIEEETPVIKVEEPIVEEVKPIEEPVIEITVPKKEKNKRKKK